MFAALCWTTVNGQTGGYRGGTADRLSGTYELDRSRSDDATRVAQQATRSLPPGQRDRAYQNLLTRLDAPEQISIDLRGRAVTMASTAGPRLDFQADGRNRTETGPNGRAMTTHADVRGQVLSVSTTGNRGSDYTVRFEPVPGGLRVTRRLDSDTRNISATSQSFYRRIGTEPSWALYDEGSRYGTVPGGTLITARLDTDVNSRTAREGDRFTMTVVGPNAYRNATLDGYVVRAEDANGHNTVVFDFDRVRLSNGRSTPFDGTIQSVRTPDGRTIRVSQTGGVRDQSGYNASNAGHAAIGAAIGAIIGAIAGGGKGAVIGGAAGGAGTLLLDRPEDLSLRAGTEMTIATIGAQTQAARR
jgi:hypothetical protein